jgi:hypothetical protein
VRYLITGNMVADWHTVPLFAASHGDHQFFIQATSATQPPEENPPLETKDTAMIEDIEAGLAGFNMAVTTSAETVRNTPPPPPPAPDARGFWRIKANWSLDSDNDGSYDHLEFAHAAQAPAPDGLAGNAFNADTNNDGIPDGEQMDSDGDSIPDAEDIDPKDGHVAYANVALPRYAMFTIAANNHQMFAINDRGTALAQYGYWKSGQTHNLITDGEQVTDYPGSEVDDRYGIHARAINDNDQIIGAGIATLINPTTGGPNRLISPILYWSTPEAVPVVVSSTDGTTITYANRIFDGNYYSGRHLDNSGSFFSPAVSWDLTRPDSGPKDAYEGWKKWTLPPGGEPFSHEVAPENSKGTAAGGIVWGSAYEAGEWLNSNITSPFSAEIPVYEPEVVIAQGADGNIIAASRYAGIPTMVRKDGEWGISPLLEDIQDISVNGTAIGKRVASKGREPAILLNGKWTGLERAVPGIPERWKTSPDMWLADTSPGGWILAHDRPGEDEISAALLPLRFKGRYTDSAENVVERAVGVDDFSIGSNDPASSIDNIDHVQDRLWIMAPLGGAAKTVVLNAPIHASAPIELSADGILFDGEEEAVCASPETILNVTASSAATSGEEKLMTLKMGDSESISKPIGFKVMKHRTVKVVVWRVTSDRNPPGMVATHPDYEEPKAPDFNPTEEDLEDKINDYFAPQINTVFNCEIKSITVNFDIATNVDFGVPEEIPAKNGHLDMDGLDKGEFKLIHAKGYDDTKSINVYFVGRAIYVTSPRWLPASNKSRRSFADGITMVDERICIIANGFQMEPEEQIDTLCHEIGHIIIGIGHPDNKDEESVILPNTNYVERLMCSGPRRRKDGFSRLMVKQEWDRAHVWLKQEEDDKRILP